MKVSFKGKNGIKMVNGYNNDMKTIKVVLACTISLLLLPIFPLQAMEDVVASTPKILKRVSASERLGFVERQLTKCPSLTMYDKIQGEFWDIYQRDKAFITQQSQKWPNGLWIRSKLDETDVFIREKGFEKEMSFADYTFVGYAWANILTAAFYREKMKSGFFTPDDYENLTLYNLDYDKSNQPYRECLSGTSCYETVEECFRQFNLALTEAREFRHEGMHLRFLGTAGFVFPHISMTGIVPIQDLNDGWAFFTTDTGDASYVDFLAVGTNIGLMWDGVKDATCLSSWGHDVAHIGGSKRIKSAPNQDVLRFVGRIASLRKAVNDAGYSDAQMAKYELAFNIIFRERQFIPLHWITFHTFVSDLINQINSDFDQGTLKSIGPFSQKIQMEFNVLAAKSLGINCEGDTNFEKQNPYLRTLKEGCEILLKFSHLIDEGKNIE